MAGEDGSSDRRRKTSDGVSLFLPHSADAGRTIHFNDEAHAVLADMSRKLNLCVHKTRYSTHDIYFPSDMEVHRSKVCCCIMP